ncbi:chitinase-3-like protein 1 [Halichoeres trimaculatus]|uniref:chitinase-3-like protein 1 n=1 Tax=Halichoeres trimaculatus TaxID=147232 RepID=UPI003D9F7575
MTMPSTTATSGNFGNLCGNKTGLIPDDNDPHCYYSCLCLVLASLASSRRLICAYNRLAEARADYGQFSVSDIDPNLCTHLAYASADIKDNKLAPVDVGDVQQYIDFNALKESNPKLKTLLIVGGTTFDKKKFSSMVQTKENRAEFIDSAVKLLRTMKFDGLILDWQYPGGPGSQPQDKQRFTELCKEFRNAFEADGIARGEDRLILSASVAAERAIIDASYEVEQIAEHLDFIVVRAFDFHGPWENVTGHHSPLYTGPQDTGDNIYSNADSAMSYWRDQGAPAEKLNMGIGAFGQAFTLASDSTAVGAPARGPAEEGCYTGKEGFWATYEICIYLEGVEIQRISGQRDPFAETQNQWVGFDDKTSLTAKANYLNEKGYGGAFVWSLDLDDFKGEFCEQGENPFIRQLHDLLVPGFPQSAITTPTPNYKNTHNYPNYNTHNYPNYNTHNHPNYNNTHNYNIYNTHNHPNYNNTHNHPNYNNTHNHPNYNTHNYNYPNYNNTYNYPNYNNTYNYPNYNSTYNYPNYNNTHNYPNYNSTHNYNIHNYSNYNNTHNYNIYNNNHNYQI